MRWLEGVSNDYFELEDRLQLTRAMLRQRMDDAARLDEGDLFATFLLALYGFQSAQSQEPIIHLRGFLTLFKAPSRQKARTAAFLYLGDLLAYG